VTDDMEKAGYIMPNGHFLFLNRPYTDHRDVRFHNWSSTQKVTSGTPRMHEFMILGAIRIDGIAGGIHIARSPTGEQLAALAKFIRFLDGTCSVDLADKPEWNMRTEDFFFNRKIEQDFYSTYPADVFRMIAIFYDPKQKL